MLTPALELLLILQDRDARRLALDDRTSLGYGLPRAALRRFSITTSDSWMLPASGSM